MIKTSLKSLMMGGKIAALAALMGGTALAQTTETVVVPAPALEAGTPVGVVAAGIPVIEQLDNDQSVAETLIAQGFTDVVIRREGALMTVTANRAGEPIELVYSVANGTLVSINGEELRDPPEASSGADVPAPAAAPADDVDEAADDATDESTDDAADDAADDGAADDANDDGMSDDGDADGADGAGDTSDSDTDSGSDADGADSGGEADSGTDS